jgi:hypothetical protein
MAVRSSTGTPERTRATMRATRAVVLPEPAAARTKKFVSGSKAERVGTSSSCHGPIRRRTAASSYVEEAEWGADMGAVQCGWETTGETAGDYPKDGGVGRPSGYAFA